VRVENRIAGANVLVFVDGAFMGEGRSDFITTFLMLQAGQKVTARQLAGGLLSDESDPVEVRPIARIHAPHIESPVDSCGPSARLTHLMPGARIHVFANGLVISSQYATDTEQELNLQLRPWPGWQVHATQSLAVRQSADSNSEVATGAISVTTWHGNEAMSLRHPDSTEKTVAVSHCFSPEPVPESTTITLYSTGPGVVDIVGSNQETLMSNSWNSRAYFDVRAGTPGVARLVAEADHYRLTQLDWVDPDDGLDVEVTGAIQLNPGSANLTTGDSLTVTVSAYPRPSNGRINLSSDSSSVEVPGWVAIPFGQNSTTFSLEALNATSGATVRGYRTNFQEATMQVVVESAPVTQEHYDLGLNWACPGSGACWVEGLHALPVPGGTLTGFQNQNGSVYLWFATGGADLQDACSTTEGTLLAHGDSIESTDLGFPSDQSMASSFVIQTVPCCAYGQLCGTQVPGLFIRILYDLEHD
jgi:hypothetical protein